MLAARRRGQARHARRRARARFEAYERALELDPAERVHARLPDRALRGETTTRARSWTCTSAAWSSRREDDEELKYTLLVRPPTVLRGEAQRSGAGDRRCSDHALAVRPGDRAVLTALNRLYRAEEMWPELLDNLQLEASTADRGRRARRAAQADRRDPRRPSSRTTTKRSSAYRLVLDEPPDDADAVIAAVRASPRSTRSSGAGRRNPGARAALERRCEELVRGARDAADDGDRSDADAAETLRAIAEVLETKLGRAGDAQARLLRALGGAARCDRAARGHRAAGARRRTAGRATPTPSPSALRRPSIRTSARISGRGSASVAEAASSSTIGARWRRTSERSSWRATSPSLLEALDRLYTRLERHKSLAEDARTARRGRIVGSRRRPSFTTGSACSRFERLRRVRARVWARCAWRSSGSRSTAPPRTSSKS